MKKLLSLVLVLVLGFAFSACNGDDPLAELQDQIDALQAVIDGYETDLTAIETDLAAEVATLETTIAALQTALTALETATGADKTALEAEIAVLEAEIAVLEAEVASLLAHLTFLHKQADIAYDVIPTDDGVGYDLVHGHYVGVSTIRLIGDIVFDVTIDEYYLPYSWAKIGTGFNPADTPAADAFLVQGSRGANNLYAKYIVIDNVIFCTGEASPHAAGSQIPLYNCVDGITPLGELEAWVAADEANAKYYADSFIGWTDWATSGNYIATITGTRHATYVTVASDASSVHILKSLSPYWRTGTLGWLGNVEQTRWAVIGLDLSAGFAAFDLVRGAGNLWSIDDAVTGATWSDFPDYFGLIVRAYDNAVGSPS